MKPQKIGELTIAASDTESSEFDLGQIAQRGSIGLAAPAALDGTELVVQVADGNDVFGNLKSGAAAAGQAANDLTIAAGERIALGFMPFSKIRVQSNAAETGGPRVVEVWAV